MTDEKKDRLLSEDHSEIKLVPQDARDLWDPNRPKPLTPARRKAAEEAARRYRDRERDAPPRKDPTE